MNNLQSTLAIANTMEESDLILSRIDSEKSAALRIDKEMENAKTLKDKGEVPETEKIEITGV